MTAIARGFGEGLRWWRTRRGLSQLDLSCAADISQRHLSFLESGRTSPSREMVLRLGAVLDMPLRQQNVLLLAAGFAPAWRESDLSAPELAQVNSAIAFILDQQEPYPAFVVDRRWNLLRANSAAARMVNFFTAPAPMSLAPGSINLAAALIAPEGLKSFIVNWDEVALYFLRSVQADALADGTAETAALLQQLLTYPDVPDLSRAVVPAHEHAPVLTMAFRKEGTTLRLFTTIVTLGTPHDVTLQEIRVECFFPADEGSRDLFRLWASPSA